MEIISCRSWFVTDKTTTKEQTDLIKNLKWIEHDKIIRKEIQKIFTSLLRKTEM